MEQLIMVLSHSAPGWVAAHLHAALPGSQAGVLEYIGPPRHDWRIHSGRAVWPHAEQYFGSVPQYVWEFKVGSYHVCEKWLNDRKGRILSRGATTHYQLVLVELNGTIRLMQETDKSITDWLIK